MFVFLSKLIRAFKFLVTGKIKFIYTKNLEINKKLAYYFLNHLSQKYGQYIN